MGALTVKLSDEHADKKKSEVSALIDEEVERFSQFMENEIPDIRARGPLMTPERMLLKTFLIQKLTGKL